MIQFMIINILTDLRFPRSGYEIYVLYRLGYNILQSGVSLLVQGP